MRQVRQRDRGGCDAFALPATSKMAVLKRQIGMYYIRPSVSPLSRIAFFIAGSHLVVLSNPPVPAFLLLCNYLILPAAEKLITLSTGESCAIHFGFCCFFHPPFVATCRYAASEKRVLMGNVLPVHS